jgi:hypothetical protein
VTLEEARQLIRELGWTPFIARRGKHVYLEAARKIAHTRRNEHRHIGALYRLEEMQPEEIKKKLAP